MVLPGGRPAHRHRHRHRDGPPAVWLGREALGSGHWSGIRLEVRHSRRAAGRRLAGSDDPGLPRQRDRPDEEPVSPLLRRTDQVSVSPFVVDGLRPAACVIHDCRRQSDAGDGTPLDDPVGCRRRPDRARVDRTPDAGTAPSRRSAGSGAVLAWCLERRDASSDGLSARTAGRFGSLLLPARQGLRAGADTGVHRPFHRPRPAGQRRGAPGGGGRVPRVVLRDQAPVRGRPVVGSRPRAVVVRRRIPVRAPPRRVALDAALRAGRPCRVPRRVEVDRQPWRGLLAKSERERFRQPSARERPSLQVGVQRVRAVPSRGPRRDAGDGGHLPARRLVAAAEHGPARGSRTRGAGRHDGFPGGVGTPLRRRRSRVRRVPWRPDPASPARAGDAACWAPPASC